MAEDRTNQEVDKDNPSRAGHVQTAGRKENAAQPLNAADDNEGVERYPATRTDDTIERSFKPKDGGKPD